MGVGGGGQFQKMKAPGCLLQVLYKVYISFVEVGPENVQTADYFKGVGGSKDAIVSALS